MRGGVRGGVNSLCRSPHSGAYSQAIQSFLKNSTEGRQWDSKGRSGREVKGRMHACTLAHTQAHVNMCMHADTQHKHSTQTACMQLWQHS